MTIKALKSMLLETLERSRLHSVSYTDFFLLFMKSYGYQYEGTLTLLSDIINEIVSKMNKLAEIIERLPDTLKILRNRVTNLKRLDYNPFLVDCLGFPEIYEIYRQVVERCGVLSVKIEMYVNGRAMTYRFEDAFYKGSMVEIARELGTSLYKSLDKMVHHEFGEPMGIEYLISLANARLRVYVDDLVEDVIDKRRAFIVADHGYDIYCDEDNRCYLGHGRDARFAKISPLIVVTCDSCKF